MYVFVHVTIFTVYNYIKYFHYNINSQVTETAVENRYYTVSKLWLYKINPAT